ncbi:MAG: exo-beta-N-acetylmuramidase NamZ domain-containing protein [Fimbriiglobus sp.]
MRGVALLVALMVVARSEAQLPGVDEAVAAAIAKGGCPGAVVVVVQGDKIIHRKAYGDRAVKPNPEPMTVDTTFDLASLTKPMATATSVMKLVEDGKLRLSDPVSQYWPEFAANGKKGITIEQCLLHTTGLTADNAIGDYADGRAKAFENIAALKLEAPPGTRFKYSDVGFLVLGHIVEKVSGMSLDAYAAKHVFQPLAMNDTSYLPTVKDRVAPTGLRKMAIIRGEVHDPRAFAIGGVAGHAGLFGTADDLARYARMLLNGGELDGVRVLSPLTVQLFTQPRPVLPFGSRSRGWDVDTGFTAQRGELFPAGDGFGHTGFTGTSLWVDQPSKTAIILLTNRVHPADKGNVTELRRQLGTLVAKSLPATTRTALNVVRDVLPGIDVLRAEGFARLKGQRVALVTNHTGLAKDGTATIDLLAKAEGVKLVALFSPEHGIRGEVDDKVKDGKDEKTGLPIYSLYGERTRPTPEQLQGIDVIVYDIQDIGCRFYTYISTLGNILQAAAEAKVRVLVLDRPNPLGGLVVEGPMRDAMKESFVAYHDLPLRHGMTVGELAKMFVVERKIDVKLDVVLVNGWKRGDTFERTGLAWRNPSPNMRHLTAAFVYPGVGLLETTNISVGRGTERPFEWIGAPWLDAAKFAANMNARRLPGVAFVPVKRKPTYSVNKDQDCFGVDILVLDRSRMQSVPLGLHLASALREVHPTEWNPKSFNRLLVSEATATSILAGKAPSEITSTWSKSLDEYLTRREAFLLYRE